MNSLEGVLSILPEPNWVGIGLSGNIDYASLVAQLGLDEVRVDPSRARINVVLRKQDVIEHMKREKELENIAVKNGDTEFFAKPSFFILELYWESKAQYAISLKPLSKKADLAVYALNDSDLIERVTRALQKQNYDITCKYVPL